MPKSKNKRKNGGKGGKVQRAKVNSDIKEKRIKEQKAFNELAYEIMGKLHRD